MKVLLITATIFLIVSGCDTQELADTEISEITETFMMTKDAWNEGNLEKFMEGYHKSEDIVFVGSAGPIYGYDATLERYRTSYPDTTIMGKLDFEILKLYKVDKKTALLIGKYYLTRTIGNARGYYTLVWQKIDGKWVIIADHSSASETI